MAIRSRMIACLTMAVIPFGLNAQEQESEASAVPVEAFYCDLQEGKDMEDLVSVADRFSKWADKHNTGYSAWILTPAFGQFQELPQVIWLGSNQSGDAMGEGLDAWLKTGGDIQEAFDEVVACNAHALASSTSVLAPEGPPHSGVVMFTQCSLTEGDNWMSAVQAHAASAQGMRDLGAENSNWLFFPMLGGAALDFDYWSVATFSDWTSFFTAYELYVNGGGWQQMQQLLDGVAQCSGRTPTVWNAELVRRAEQ